MRIGIDIDDVLFPWYDKAHAACIAAGITNGAEPTSWSPFDQYGCTEQEWFAALEVATLNGSLHSGEPFPGTVEGLTRLRDAGHTIHIVTARGCRADGHGHLIREHTVQWLAQYAVPHDTLTFSKDKTIVKTDVFADDSERNIEALVAAGIRCILIDAPHNQHVEHYRVPGIAEFVDDVLASFAQVPA